MTPKQVSAFLPEKKKCFFLFSKKLDIFKKNNNYVYSFPENSVTDYVSTRNF